ncbi:MAG TPA: hypothetical protein VF492_05450 [Verrucomicrobiae bacterium]
MMNDETEQFEHRLSRQPLRQIPPAWRAEILREGRRVAVRKIGDAGTVSLSNQSWPSSILHSLSSLLWPHPKAWAGLAAVWIFIFTVNFSLRDSSPRLAEKSAPPSPEVIVELRQQQRLFAELVGPREERDADRSKAYKSHPRTESVAVLTA